MCEYISLMMHVYFRAFHSAAGVSMLEGFKMADGRSLIRRKWKFKLKITMRMKKKEKLFNVNECIAFVEGGMQACVRWPVFLKLFEKYSMILWKMTKFWFFSKHASSPIRAERKPFGWGLQFRNCTLVFIEEVRYEGLRVAKRFWNFSWNISVRWDISWFLWVVQWVMKLVTHHKFASCMSVYLIYIV